MDVPRSPAFKRKKLIRRIVIGVVIALAVPAITWGVLRLQPAAFAVDANSVVIETVKHGPMVRQVRGLGTLVPLEVLFIPALNAGRVERIFIRPGTPVKADTVILQLSNPELLNEAVTAEFNLKAAEAGYTDLRVQLQSQGFDKQAAAAQVNSDFRQAKLKADRDKKLSDAGLIPDVDLKLSTTQAEELAERDAIEQKRLKIIDESVQAQLDAKKVNINQLRALFELKKHEVDQLNVRAGVAGVLVDLPVEVGQQIAAGAVLAKVTQPNRLKAQLKITETEAKDIITGQQASIDTHNGVIAGKVIRIDPAAVNGTVTVDVGLTEELPPGARPDLSVDGTVELERLNDVVYVGRPTNGQPNSTSTLFKVTPDGKYASRVTVKFGKASVSTIEVVDGLKIGDRVIISDQTTWGDHDRIRLN
jgi:HlyD family secretion protein